MRVILDGPYGGIDLPKIMACPQQLVVAGGSGAGWIMPLLSAFLLRQPLAGSSTLSLKIVLATREAATRAWFEDAIRDLLAEHEIEKLPEGLDIDLYFTGSQGQMPNSRPRSQVLQQLDLTDKVPAVTNNDLAHTSDSETSSDPSRMAYTRHFEHRPDLPAIIKTEAMQSTATGQLGVFVCGPPSMQSDVSSAVAAEQLAILRGGLRDIYLHMEHFSWA